MPLSAAPHRLFDEFGMPKFGVYEGAVWHLNLDAFDFTSIRRGLMSRIRLLAPLYLKRWHYVGVTDEKFVLGAACVSLSYMGMVFAYLYERRQRKLHAFEALAAGARGIRFSESAVAGRTRARVRDMACDFVLEGSPNEVRLRAGGRLRADLSLDVSALVPLSCVTRIGLGGFNYTHKLAGIPAEGTVEIDNRRYNLENPRAVLDYTLGVPARETFWNWASGGGRLASGRSFGINFAAGINETGFTENVFWIDGKIHKVDAVHFEYDRRNVMRSPWRVTSGDGAVDLVFRPEGQRAAKVNLWLVASAFQQPFGVFSGTLETEAGKHVISEGYGFVEEHFARW